MTGNSALDMLIYGVILAVVAGILGFLAQRLRTLDPDSVVLKTLLMMVDSAIKAVLKQVTSTIDGLPLQEQRAEIDKLAASFYAGLPTTLVVKVGSINIMVPFKMIVTEAGFQEMCWHVYRGIGDLATLLKQMIENQYETWKETGSTLPAELTRDAMVLTCQQK